MILNRTFHPDEANQAFTVGRLLETGSYTYRPTDHHGPTLYYAAAPLQHAFGHDSTTSLDGTLLRCTPLLFAILTLVMLFHGFFKLLRFAGCRPLAATIQSLLPVVLLGSAPLFVFFATDFIQEMLLVAFTVMMLWAGIGYRVSLTSYGGRLKPGSWALLFGIAAGLAFATKETSVLAFAAAALSLLICRFICKSPVPSGGQAANLRPQTVNSLVFALLAFILTSVVLFSSLGRNWHGVYDAFISAPLAYLGRAAGDATASAGANWHIHPWWQHLEWLFFGRLIRDAPAHWSATFPHLLPAIFLLTFAIPALAWGKFRTALPQPLLELFAFLLTYTVLLTAGYSVVPYKTPWCTLQLLVPYLITSALGLLLFGRAVEMIDKRRNPTPANLGIAACVLPLVLVAAIIGCEHLPGLFKLHRDPNSPAIPYNYAHASPEVKALANTVAERMRQLSTLPNDNSADRFIAVVLPACDTWPFPWYNREFEPVTGYWEKFEDLQKLAESGAKPAVVIVPMAQGHLVQPLFPHLKNTRRFFIRPGVRVRVFW